MAEGRDKHPTKEKGVRKHTWRRGTPTRSFWSRVVKRTGPGDKTLWDFLQLLIVPLMLAGIGLWFSAQQDIRQRELEDQRAQDAALQAYLDQMSTLLLEENLRGSEQDSEARTLARARTSTILEGLDAQHKRKVFAFLNQAESINKGTLVVSLGGVNLSEADLSNFLLDNIDFGGHVDDQATSSSEHT